MASYIAYYKKKKNLLVKREQDLWDNLWLGAPQTDIEKSAQKVRKAKLRVFNAMKATVIPASERSNNKQLAKIARETAVWESMSLKDIINIYKKKKPKKIKSAIERIRH